MDQMSSNAGVIPRKQFLSSTSPGLSLHDNLPTTQTRCVRRHGKLKRMKSEWNEPSPRKRSEIFAIVDLAQTNVAGRLININFRFRRRSSFPIRLGPLRRNKI